MLADLTRESFAVGYARLKAVAQQQLERRRQALAEIAARGATPDLYTGSPCLFCLQSFGKIPWRPDQANKEAGNDRKYRERSQSLIYHLPNRAR